MKSIMILSIYLVAVKSETNSSYPITNGTLKFPCKDNSVIVKSEPDVNPKDTNQYNVYVNKDFPKDCSIKIVFNSQVIITYVAQRNNKEYPRTLPKGDTFSLKLYQPQESFNFTVKGSEQGVTPYLLGFSVNGVEYCQDPKVGFLNPQPTNSIACGRRVVKHRELSATELPKNPANISGTTTPGDWPWHTAVRRLDNSVFQYICGGTLISKNFVLTAGHCVIDIATLKPYPSDDFSVVLGKYWLKKMEEVTQEKNVLEVIVAKDFNVMRFYRDIGLLKLKTDVVFNDFIQPACLWDGNHNTKMVTDQILGTIVGWGYDDDNNLSEIPLQATIPIVSDEKCVNSNPSFFGVLLNGYNFCAGYHDGTAPCQGDSGGAFQVFIPDEIQKDEWEITGTWHVKGILSIGVVLPDQLICDPEQYVVFTDVEKFKDWIDQYLEVAGTNETVITEKFGQQTTDEGEGCLTCNTSSVSTSSEATVSSKNRSGTGPLTSLTLLLYSTVSLLLYSFCVS